MVGSASGFEFPTNNAAWSDSVYLESTKHRPIGVKVMKRKGKGKTVTSSSAANKDMDVVRTSLDTTNKCIV